MHYSDTGPREAAEDGGAGEQEGQEEECAQDEATQGQGHVIRLQGHGHICTIKIKAMQAALKVKSI